MRVRHVLGSPLWRRTRVRRNSDSAFSRLFAGQRPCHRWNRRSQVFTRLIQAFSCGGSLAF